MGTKASDFIDLKLILVSGKTAEFQFQPTTTASDVAKYVFENWPADWTDQPRPDRHQVLRLIYQGRFLHGNVSLGALRLQQGKTIVMHLVQRESLPEATSGTQKRNRKHSSNRARTINTITPTNNPNSASMRCCSTCSIL